MEITIDGPAGAGKSTVARAVAQETGFLYLNSGSFYRAITWAVLDRGLDPGNPEEVIGLARQAVFALEADGLHLNGNRVEDLIRSDSVDQWVAKHSAIPQLREIVNARLREIGSGRNLVSDGRDMGTVVFPRAAVKVYLDADVKTRAERRFRQGVSGLSLEEIGKSIQERDLFDKGKPVGRLKKAPGAIDIDTSGLTIEQVCERVVVAILKKANESGRNTPVMSTEDKKILTPGPENQLEAQYVQSFQPIEEGQMIPGRVVEISSDYVYVDVGYKSEGKIPTNEFEKPPTIGESVYVILIRKEGKEGQVIVSKRKADEKIFWKDLRKAFDEHAPVEGTILRRIKGGFEVDLGNDLHAFLPQSKVDVKRAPESAEFSGVKSFFYIDRLYAKGKTNIVVDRRQWMEEDIKKRRDAFFQNVKIGDVVEGVVKSFTSFGAFVDLGGFDGLLHINDMSWGHVTRPKDFVKLGESIHLKVIRLEPEESRINLSLKHFSEDPWNHFEEKYHIGDVVKGRVTKLTDFGAFIEIEEGIEGLAHISELSWVKRVKHPREVVKPGDVVETKILNYDIQQGKLSLGLKQVLPNPWDEIDQHFPVGMRMKRTVKNLSPSALFFEIEEGIDGILHVDDISWTKKHRNAASFAKPGDEIEFMILAIDREKQKIQLGVKQLSEDPWESLARAYPRGSVIDGEITSITEFGFFVKVQGGIEGLLHKTNMSDPALEPVEALIARYKVGDPIRSMVVEVSPSKQKLSLSLRDLAKRQQKEEMEKYIQDDSREEKVSVADLIKDKMKS
jgi:small subunit ribosomal protein S1